MENGARFALGLIGHFDFIKLNKEDHLAWVTEHWNPLINYVPNIIILTNSWVVFLFLESKDAQNMLDRLWVINYGSLVLDKWHLGFDPLRKKNVKR